VMMESRVNETWTKDLACNMTRPSADDALRTRSHLPNIMTSSAPAPLFAVYAEALAWLRQLHAMCAGADAPFPLPFPTMTSAEPAAACYVTKMAAGVAPMQPFDPCWTSSCPSPSTAPCVDPPPPVRNPPSSGRHVGGRARDFSIPSILSRAGSASTGADSDGTTESDERCQSATSSLDDAWTGAAEQCNVVTSLQRHVTSYDELMTHQNKQHYECPQCNKVCRSTTI